MMQSAWMRLGCRKRSGKLRVWANQIPQNKQVVHITPFQVTLMRSLELESQSLTVQRSISSSRSVCIDGRFDNIKPTLRLG